jgi:hypothetical protein
VQDRYTKSACVGLAMITLAKVRMPSWVSTMLTHQQKELNVVEKNTCNCFRPTWKPTSRAMVAKVLQIVSWVLVRSLPLAQSKRWIPIGSMLAIDRWGSPSRIRHVVKKIGEDN